MPVVKKIGYQTGYPVDYQVTGQTEYPVSGFQISWIFGKFGIWCIPIIFLNLIRPQKAAPEN